MSELAPISRTYRTIAALLAGSITATIMIGTQGKNTLDENIQIQKAIPSIKDGTKYITVSGNTLPIIKQGKNQLDQLCVTVRRRVLFLVKSDSHICASGPTG